MPNFSKILDQEKPILVNFFATWCGPCKSLAPIIKQVKDTLKDDVVIIKIDIDKNQKFAAKMQVKGVPTLILYKNKKIVWRQSGVLPKHIIVAKIKEYI